MPVTVFRQRLRQGFKLAGINESVTPGDLFRAGDLEALPVFQRGDELAGIQQALVGACIEPGIAALEDLHVQLALLQIGLVDSGDFQLAAGAGLDRFGDIDHLAVVEIEAGDGVITFRLRRLFLNADRLAAFVERHHAVTFRILHVVSEHGATLLLTIRIAKQRGEIVTVEDVIAEHKRAGGVADKVFTDDESLREPIRTLLDGILQINAPLRSVAQQLLETRQIARRADDQDIAHAGQHQRAQRVVDHRFVVDRQQLLAQCQRGRMQPGTGAAGEYDAFSREW